MHYDELIGTLQNLIHRKVTQKELSAVLCISAPTTMSGRANRNSRFTTEEIRKIEKHFNVNILKENIQNNSNDEIFADYYSEFELVNNELSGKKETVHISKSLIDGFLPEKKYFIIKACGESMIPNIKNGDKLIIEDYNKETIKDNQIYFFFYNKQFFVKRLIGNINKIVVKSDNTDPIYSPEFITRNEMKNIKIIGKISGLIRNYE